VARWAILSATQVTTKKVKRANAKAGSKWKSEREALKKIQFHFDMQVRQIQNLRVKAAYADMNPSDYVRKIVELPYRTLDRPRVSLSFSPDDLEFLASRYDVDADDGATIRKRVKQEVEAYLVDES